MKSQAAGKVAQSHLLTPHQPAAIDHTQTPSSSTSKELQGRVGMSQGGQGHHSSPSSCGKGPLPEDLSGNWEASGEHGWGLLTPAAFLLDTCCFCHAQGARRSWECGLPRLPRTSELHGLVPGLPQVLRTPGVYRGVRQGLGLQEGVSA